MIQYEVVLSTGESHLIVCRKDQDPEAVARQKYGENVAEVNYVGEIS